MTPQVNDWTIGRLLTWTTDYLKEHDSDSPRLEAEVLLAEARGCERIELYTSYDEVADERTRTAFRELVRRRAEGTPVAYLVGRREFYSMSFRVTPDVLVPRPETEFLVAALLDLAKERPPTPEPIRIIDIGTGSGILAICAAKHLESTQIHAVDLSPSALDVAQANARDHGVVEEIQFLKSDLFTNVPDDLCFDFIVSNPPYVSEAEYEELPVNVREHEPRQALVGGATGVEIIERLIAQAPARLPEGGYLLFEISPMIEVLVRERLDDCDSFVDVNVIKDFSGHARIVTARRS